MVGADTVRSRALERRSPALFLVGGVLLVVYATFNAIAASTGATYPAVENSFGPGGFALGFLGLLGVARGLTDRSPVLARVGAVAAALGASGFSVIALSNLGRVAGVVPSGEPAWFPVLLLVAATGMVVGYPAVAAARLRTGARSRALGLLLVAPAVVFATMVAQATLFTQFGLLSAEHLAWSAVAISGGQAAAHLAIGRVLRAERASTGREAPAGDPTAG